MSNGHVKIYSTNAKTSMLFVSLLVLYNNDSFEIGELKNVHYQFLKNPEAFIFEKHREVMDNPLMSNAHCACLCDPTLCLRSRRRRR